jgi:hypothetical protein
MISSSNHVLYHHVNKREQMETVFMLQIGSHLLDCVVTTWRTTILLFAKMKTVNILSDTAFFVMNIAVK